MYPSWVQSSPADLQLRYDPTHPYRSLARAPFFIQFLTVFPCPSICASLRLKDCRHSSLLRTLFPSLTRPPLSHSLASLSLSPIPIHTAPHRPLLPRLPIPCRLLFHSYTVPSHVTLLHPSFLFFLSSCLLASLSLSLEPV